MFSYFIADSLINSDSALSGFEDFRTLDFGTAALHIHQKDMQTDSLYNISVVSHPERVIHDATYGDMATANEDWSEINYYPAKNPNPDKAVILSSIISKLSFDKTIFFHGSLVSLDGKGVMFVGRSGIGKTTQAKLWNKYLGAKIINGDKVFVRIKDGKAYGWGSPWKGSSPYCLNEGVQLAGVVSLAQGKENELTVLDDFGKAEKIMNHIFLPMWDEKCLAGALETTNELFSDSAITFLRLSCRPDEEAVMKVKELLWK